MIYLFTESFELWTVGPKTHSDRHILSRMKKMYYQGKLTNELE